MIYRFEDAELDLARFELRVDGTRVPVEPQVFEVLAHLVRNRDRLVPRTELLDTVWGDRFVSDSALSSRIKAARAAIGDDGRTQRLIRTVHGRGVQFVAEVEEAPDLPEPEPAVGELPHQTVRFVRTTDGTSLAVAEIGDGVPLVKAPNWLTHVEKDWESPVWRHWMTELGRRYRYIRYDARGCGLSDRDLGDVDLTDPDVWTSDLEAVVDDIEGLDRFVLFGMSQGGIPAVNYAVRHPERVSHLILFGCYARGQSQRGGDSAAVARVLVDLLRVGWGGKDPAFRSVFTMKMLPNATSEYVRWFNELQLQTADPENAARLESAFHGADLTGLAPKVDVPTLVIHCRDDAAVPYDQGRLLASLIPGAELVTLDSANHILMPGEPAWPEFLRHVERFTSTA